MVLSGVSGWLNEFVYFGLSVVAFAWGLGCVGSVV